MFKIKSIQSYYFVLFLLLCNSILAQSITGTSGLVTIPSADMPKDGEIAFGTSFTNKKYNVLSPDKYHQLAYYISLGYLPFLEVSIRITRQLNYPAKQAIGDRMPSVRIRFLEEKELFPSIVLGAHDFIWAFGGTEAIHHNALYLVCSKHFQLKDYPINLGFHAGYGTDWIKAANHEFVGLFGGVSAYFNQTLGILLEYDAKKFNSGLNLILFDHIVITAALLNFNTFSGNINYKFILD